MATNLQLNGDELHQRQKQNKQINAPMIICDGLKTPENLGSILRVADAVGSKGIILLDNEMDFNNKKISKIARSANKQFNIECISFDTFLNSKNRFENLFALEITSHSVNAFESSIINCDAVLLGHESKGIRQAALAICNGVFHLPMFGTNGSMNVSHALAVFLYEWRRQQI